ncbi:MAG: ribose-phosphate pyrophosphokinase [Candidatus Levybacteria bacterium]|nr:ribose-phosphate pyrophosphokinase [Candidatus Levybacteria bacterium]
MKIFSGTSNKPLAENLAKDLGIELSPLEVFIFPDGEKRIRILDKVLDEDVFVVQSTSKPADENYMELFFIIDALKRSGAKSITAIVPYFGYQRQDHQFRDGEAVSVKVVAEILEKVGINKLIALDLHSIKIEQAFDISVIHLSALSIFAKFIKEKVWDKNSTLVSPDMGGIRRIKILSKMLGDMPYSIIEKNRDLATGFVFANKIEGKIGKRAIIVDDMISTGETIDKAASLLKKNEAEDIVVFATHPVFSEIAPKILQESGVSSVYVTDTIFVPKEKRFPKLKILSVSELISTELKKNS